MISLHSLWSLWLNFSMRQLIVMMVVASLLGCAGAPKRPTWSNVTGAEQYERLMWQALQDKDWANFERHLSPTFVGVNGDGQSLDRPGWLDYWKSFDLKEFSLGDLSVLPDGPDMKVNYTLRASGAAGKTTVPAGGLRVVSVWQETGDPCDPKKKPFQSRWMVIVTSMTPVVTK
jgi:uncharacterized protein DUF4440